MDLKILSKYLFYVHCRLLILFIRHQLSKALLTVIQEFPSGTEDPAKMSANFYYRLLARLLRWLYLYGIKL